jgi:hypothetical protein
VQITLSVDQTRMNLHIPVLEKPIVAYMDRQDVLELSRELAEVAALMKDEEVNQ